MDKRNKKELEDEIYELFRHSEEYLHDKNIKGLTDRFIVEGRIKRPKTSLIEGHDAIGRSYSELVALTDLKITATDLKIKISESCDMAFVLSNYTNSHIAEGKRVMDAGKRFLFLVRSDNQWKINTEMLSSNF
jgi:ketosteroid isomerase-like protein